jgi:antitoxin CptB
MDDRNAAADLNRLHWRCRRGTRELDRLLGWWLTDRYEKSDRAHRDAFARMIELPDPDLWDWLIAQRRPDDTLMLEIVDEIRAHHRV